MKNTMIIILILGLWACSSDNNTPAQQNTQTPAVVVSPTPQPEVSPVPQQPSASPTPQVIAETFTGMFVDAPVQGLVYQTASQNGLTNAQGEFTYQSGEEITFSLGGIEFPAITAQQMITPLTIFQTDDITNDAVVNMLRLLQSVDSDASPDNGITISAQARDAFAQTGISFDATDFEAVINARLMTIGEVNTQLISAQQASEHFEQTLEVMSPSNNSCESTHAMVGYSGSFSTFSHGVSGDATIVNDCTIEITNFNYDGGGPVVYFYAARNSEFESNTAFVTSELLSGQVFQNDTVTIRLPQGRTLDDFNSISVWCIDFAVDFGSVTFTAP